MVSAALEQTFGQLHAEETQIRLHARLAALAWKRKS
jgi:hypothetical protein